MSQYATHYFVDPTVSPHLLPCQVCGSKATVYLDADNLDSTPNQPFVYVQCRECEHTISSRQIFGDLSNAPLLEKLSRVIRLWNHAPQYQTPTPVRIPSDLRSNR